MKENRVGRAAKKPSGILPGAAKGAGVGFLSALALLFLFTAAANGADDPNALVKPLALAALYLGGVTAGVAAARFSRGGMAAGLLAGAIYAAAVLLLSFLPLLDSGFPAAAAAVFTALLLPASVLGSIAGRRREKRPVRR